MLHDLLACIDASDSKGRRSAFSDLGDYLEYGDWKPSELEQIIPRFISYLNTDDYQLQEIILNSLLHAYNRHKHLNVSLWPLIKTMEKLDPQLVIYSLEILALSHNVEYVDTVKSYCSSSNQAIREAAEESLYEIHGRDQTDE